MSLFRLTTITSSYSYSYCYLWLVLRGTKTRGEKCEKRGGGRGDIKYLLGETAAEEEQSITRRRERKNETTDGVRSTSQVEGERGCHVLPQVTTYTVTTTKTCTVATEADQAALGQQTRGPLPFTSGWTPSCLPSLSRSL